jgi:hypothetical protein
LQEARGFFEQIKPIILPYIAKFPAYRKKAQVLQEQQLNSVKKEKQNFYLSVLIPSGKRLFSPIEILFHKHNDYKTPLNQYLTMKIKN